MRRWRHVMAVSLALSCWIVSIAGAPRAAARSRAATPDSLTGDFDGDGYVDLAVGVAGEDVSGKNDAGAVNVIYGSAAGLAPANNQEWTLDSPGVAGRAAAKDSFGSSVAIGDFNADGFADLAVGAPGHAVSGASHAGSVTVLYGSGSGLTATGSQLWSQGGTLPGAPETYDLFGNGLAAGDFNGDGDSDLAVGAPGETVHGVGGLGGVDVIYGSGTGLTGTGSQFFTQGFGGIAGVPHTVDFVGFTVTAADFGDGSQQDLAIGNPYDNPGGVVNAGSVNVIYGSASGLSSAGNQLWSKNSAGIIGQGKKGDLFGFEVNGADFGAGSESDLAVGAPDASVSGHKGAGQVSVIYGTAGGLAATNNQLWTQDSPGVPGTAKTYDSFGNDVWGADFGGTGEADLAIGVDCDAVGGVTCAGSVNVLYGSAGGLTAAGSQLWSQDSAGIPDRAEKVDLFGGDVVGADFNDDGISDLAAAVPFEGVSGASEAGAVNVIYGTAGGLDATGAQLWTQDSAGILDSAQAGDLFGYFVG